VKPFPVILLAYIERDPFPLVLSIPSRIDLPWAKPGRGGLAGSLGGPGKGSRWHGIARCLPGSACSKLRLLAYFNSLQLDRAMRRQELQKCRARGGRTDHVCICTHREVCFLAVFMYSKVAVIEDVGCYILQLSYRIITAAL